MSPNRSSEGSVSSCLQRVFFTFTFVGLIAFVGLASTADLSTWKLIWSDCEVRVAESERARTGFYQQTIRVTVIAAVELDEP